jgi:hypothetical protein
MQLLNKSQIADALSSTPSVAAAILAEKGVHPIDFGLGRSRGKRWLKSAVDAAIQQLHSEANPKPRERKPRPQSPTASLATMSAADVYALTKQHPTQ